MTFMTATGLDEICLMRGNRGMVKGVVGRGTLAVGSKIEWFSPIGP
jgi:hypothetical protein